MADRPKTMPDPQREAVGRMTLIRRLYDWVLALAGHKHALPALAAVSFLESSVFPIPPDVLLIPMVLAAPRRAFLIAGVCLASSVAGGILGYLIGLVMFEQAGRPMLEFFGYGDRFAEFAESYNEYGALAVLVAGVTPFPYKVITILSGATGLSFPVFVMCSVIARGARFFLVAALLWKFGEPIKSFIEARLGLLFILAAVALVGSYFVVKLL